MKETSYIIIRAEVDNVKVITKKTNNEEALEILNKGEVIILNVFDNIVNFKVQGRARICLLYTSIVAVSGMDDINVGETVCPTEHQEALPVLHIDEPTLQMTFLVNNSPFAGKEGKFVTARKLEDRLDVYKRQT